MIDALSGGRIADGVAHDLNNVMTAIVTFTELALAGLPVDDPARQDLEQVLRASDRATGLIAQLMAIPSRLDDLPETRRTVTPGATPPPAS